MATSASQTYISKLGFQDRDRSNERHGLACEYLFERMMELEVMPCLYEGRKLDLEAEVKFCRDVIAGNCTGFYDSERADIAAKLPEREASLAALSRDQCSAELRGSCKVGESVNVPITSRSYVNGFADVLINKKIPRVSPSGMREFNCSWLGEIKITKEPAENVLQQINFYLSYLSSIEAVYIVTDYDPGDLKRLCVGTKIKVYRLGQVFEQWLANRTNPETEEL